MQIVALRTLRRFCERHPNAQGPIRDWYEKARKATWTSPQEVKAQFGTIVDFVSDNRAIFDLGGNNYRLVAHISYTYRSLLVKFIGTHAEYDKIDPKSVSWRNR